MKPFIISCLKKKNVYAGRNHDHMEMTLTSLLIYGLATWRISSILVNEAGPWDVFVRLRALAGIGHDKNRQAVIIPDGFFASILSCIWCCSVWVGLGWMLAKNPSGMIT